MSSQPHYNMAQRKLIGEITAVSSLRSSQKIEMYSLMRSSYDNVDRDKFDRDLSEKKDVILLRETDQGVIKGFSTLMLLTQNIDEKETTALFSGDTIIDKEYWGTDELPKWWGRYAFSLIDTMEGRELYW